MNGERIRWIYPAITWAAIVAGGGALVSYGGKAYYAQADGIQLAAETQNQGKRIERIEKLQDTMESFIKTVNEERAAAKAVREEREREERRRRAGGRSPREDDNR